MNKRQVKKERNKPMGYKIYRCCPDWQSICKDHNCSDKDCYKARIFAGIKAFAKMLKKEGVSTFGWWLSEMPTNGVYIFYNAKKKKEITLETGDNKHYAITVYDFYSCTNKEYKTMTDALKSPLQGYFYAPRLHKNSFRKERKKRLTADFCGE